MRLDKPVGALLLLWPTLWALWIAADGLPTPHLLLVFSAGVFLTRSAGCVMNDYADRDFDRYVARTRDRPLTTGKVSPREAWYLIAVLLTAAFLLVLTTNRLTIMLSFIALPLAGFYPFMKRYTYIPQLFQGMAFGWGIPMAFAAASDTVPRIAWLIYIANILWSMSYDTVYAMVDREDDKKIGVKSTAILFEDSDRFFVGLIQSMLLLTLVFVGVQLKFGWYYYLALAGVVGIIVHLQYLIKDRLPERCFQAFRRNNWLGAVVFAGIVLHYYNSVTY
ncbi:MAG: 4-hydroxybenzoate polyprenyltransferase [Gammaproteobacteria bacterium RIFCSPLOWO2_12_FULL_52_10]|nr:MAG: 4-hydroxybenzoate polyprenyltransferase [Gammaproteobacteria bacterium RIFCSPLOWO2_12_FULL_52_10]